MALTGRAAYRIAGHQFADEDFDKNANIETSKLGTRTLYYTIPATAFHLSGTSVAKTFSGVFGGVTLPDANAGAMYIAIPVPAEYDSGNVVLRIYWNSVSIAGNLKLTSEIKPVSEGDTTAVGATDTATSAANGVTTVTATMTITIAAADFRTTALEEMIGLKISRNPADGSDTLSADAIIFAVSLEFTGRG